jgi:UDP-glucose 4-epimerase
MEAPAKPHRILITGATGQLGRSLLNEIAMWPGAQVLALVRPSSVLTSAPPSTQVVNVDFYSSKSVVPVLEAFQPTAVVHCAATGMLQPRPDWPELIRFNVEVSARLCAWSAKISSCHFVHVSSGLAYRDLGRALREDDALESQHPYAATKIAAEAVVRAVAGEHRVPLTIIRPFSFSGAGDTGSRLFPSLLRAAQQRQAFDLSTGDQIRDHCAVNDVARGIALVVARRHQLPPEPQVFNFGSSRATPLRQLIEGVVAELGLNAQLNFGARLPPVFEPKYVVADTARAQSLLGWRCQTNFAYAVWELAQTLFPEQQLRQPRRSL